jgi:hypothetical protein
MEGVGTNSWSSGWEADSMERMRIGFGTGRFAASGCLALAVAANAFCAVNTYAGDSPSRAYVATEFAPNETQVSSEADLIDPEYDQKTFQFVWADSLGNLWIGFLDSAGMFQPPSGKGILVDPDAMNMIDLRVTANGPEWIQTDEGPKIVYTKFLSGRPHTPRYARLALAQPLTPGSGDWINELLSPRKARMAPYASKDAGDPAPRITYADSNRRHYWAEINDPNKEELIPLIAPSPYGVRFVAGTRAVVFTAESPIDQTLQVFKYNVDTKVTEQLTFDDRGEKSTSSVWMWPAPEYDDEYVFFVLVNNKWSSELDIYRQMPAGEDSIPSWAMTHSIVAPLSQIGSPEPFTFDGRSYVFMQLTVDQNQYPTSIWLAGIDPANPLLRKISDDSLFRWRTDPEVFITDEGPYIYYNRRDPGDPNCNSAKCTEGIFRAYTGLSAGVE